MKGKTVYKVPHQYGTRSRERAEHWAEYAREQQARPFLAEQQDRHHLETDKRLGILAEIDRRYPVGKGGTALQDWPQLRPMRHHVFARRRGLWEGVKANGVAIPELLDRPDSQQRGMLYDVLAVGDGVTSIKPGDCVVVNHCVAADRGDVLGDGVYEFLCDVDYVEPRQYETEHEKLPDGTKVPYQRRMSDTERRSCGDVLAVVEDVA